MKYRKFKNQDNNQPLPDEVVNTIIRVAYKDASLKESIKINKLAASDYRVKSLLDEYKATADSVHSIKPEECPAELTLNLKNERGKGKSDKPSFLLDIYTAFFAKPVVTAASISVLIAVVFLSVLLNKQIYYDGYKTAEVEQANRQAKYALSIIGKVFKSTTNSLASDILTDRVSKPINEGIKTVNKLFNDEEVKK